MIRTSLALAALFLMGASAPALGWGRDDRWLQGFGQGVVEAVVTSGPGSMIVVTCAEYLDLSLTGITFNINGQPPTGLTVLLVYDDGSQHEAALLDDGRIGVQSRVHMSHYFAAIADLRRHSSVTVYFENGLRDTFTLRGSAQAIPPCTNLY